MYRIDIGERVGEGWKTEELREAVSLYNGVIYSITKRHGYREGYRNTLMVDLGIACHVLGLDAEDIVKLLQIDGHIDGVADDEWPDDRIEKVVDYCERSWKHRALNYVLDENTYLDLSGGEIDDDYEAALV